jgi:hypothetical protein
MSTKTQNEGQRGNKSPIKNLPVRLPGQSSREHLSRLIDDRTMALVFPPALCIFAAAMEWIGHLGKSPRQPWLWTVLALAATARSVCRFPRVRKTIRPLRLGAVGEEAVGQFLEEHLRPMGFQVLHDIPAEGFNLDHVAIGPTGVFVVETKTHSKPEKGASSIKYDGETVSVNGFTPDRDPIVQSTAEARWLYDLLERSTGRKVFVQPIVVYPGWFVEPQPIGAKVWVLNEKVLPTFIGNARGSALSNEDIHLLAFHLAQYVISKSRG